MSLVGHITLHILILFLLVPLGLASARPLLRSCKAKGSSGALGSGFSWTTTFLPSSTAPNHATPTTSPVTSPSIPAFSTTTALVPAPTPTSGAPDSSSGCFPALNFQMPSVIPDTLDNWWCPMDSEYAFLGFSYEVTACQSLDQLKAEFADVRNNFSGRYVRLYGACDNPGFYDDVVDAAWEAGIGVHALIWFGFDGGDEWQTRRDSLISTLTSNPKAKFITRGVQFGSEPLFDNVLSHGELASQVLSAKAQLGGVSVPVTVSELAFGYQERGGAQDVLDAIDFINIHMLPFFSTGATSGGAAWSQVQTDVNWFIQHGNGKKMYFDENGWPSVTSPGVQPNSALAVASIPSESAYYTMLDNHCEDLKNAPGGGIGWFAHIYSESQEPGYGIYASNGQLKGTVVLGLAPFQCSLYGGAAGGVATCRA